MDKHEEARKLANKLVANMMESPLDMDQCMSVMATLMIEFAITNGYSVGTVINDLERLYEFMGRVQPNSSEVMH